MKNSIKLLSVTTVVLLALASLYGCKGGGGIVLADLSGLWNATYTITSDPRGIFELEPDELLLEKTGDETYNMLYPNEFPNPLDETVTMIVSGTDVEIEVITEGAYPLVNYRITGRMTGVASDTLMSGEAFVLFELISGEDSEGLDGYRATYTWTFTRQ